MAERCSVLSWRACGLAASLSLLFSLSLLTTLGPPAHAHNRSVSHLRVEVVAGSASATMQLSARDLSAAQAAAAHAGLPVEGWVAATHTLHTTDACVAVDPQLNLSESTFRWDLRCPPAESYRLRARGMPQCIRGHVVFATLIVDGDQWEGTLTERVEQSPAVGPGASPRSRSLGTLVSGAAHLLTGIDHICFLVCLLLLAGSRRSLVLAVTGFTTGHLMAVFIAARSELVIDLNAAEAGIAASVLLAALAVAARVDRAEQPVAVASMALGLLAAAIGATLGSTPLIALGGVALISGGWLLIDRHGRLLAPAAAVFGVLHGLGFVSSFSAPGASASRAVFTYHLGIEFAQLLIIAPLWLVLVRSSAANTRRFAIAASMVAACLSAGLVWSRLVS